MYGRTSSSGTDFGGALADDDGQLAFEVDALRLRRNADRLAGGDDGGRGFQEHERLFRDLVAELGGVLAIIAADAEDLARDDRREELRGEEWNGLEGGGGEMGPGIFFEGREQALDPEGAGAVDDFAVLGTGLGLKTAIFHRWIILLAACSL